jgi:hypothetical protein
LDTAMLLKFLINWIINSHLIENTDDLQQWL